MENLPWFDMSSFKGNKVLLEYSLVPMKNESLSTLVIGEIGLGSGLASLALSFTEICIWLRAAEKKYKNKAELLHWIVDESKRFRRCPVEASMRLMMNIPFTLEKTELETKFVEKAAKGKTNRDGVES